MRERVTIQWPERTADDAGGSGISWKDLATTWAAVSPVSGKEIVRSRLGGDVTHKVTVRYRADVTAEMRLLHGSRVLEVKAALDPGGRRRFLELYCLER